MATAKKTTRDDPVSKLAARGESTLARLAELPGGTKAFKAFNDLRDRVDDLGKKVRGIDALERRVAKLEKDVAALKRAEKQAAGSRARRPAPKSAGKSTSAG